MLPEGYDPTDLGPRCSWYDCPNCDRSVRDGEACRRCGELGRILERVESVQLQIKLNQSLARQTGGLGYVEAARALERWSTVLLSAAQELEQRLLRGDA